MTVRKGVDWGGGAVPDDLVVVTDDAEAAAALTRADADGGPWPAIGLLGGDLARTLGGRGGDEDRLRRAGTVVRVDVGEADLDGRVHLFVAHLVARRSWLRGRVVAVMNAQFLGPWDVAPRAHPGDGHLDVLDGDLGPGDRWKARSRLPSGTHVPHPGIAQRRVATWETDLGRPTPVRLDGRTFGPARHLRLTVRPDALTVVV